jgi:hypothetical protein
MSYQIQLASVSTPDVDLHVFPFMNKLRQEAGHQPPSALLQRFHDSLAALFPDTPWSDSHYAGDAGRLTVTRRRKVVVPHVLYLAGELGLTVVDNQSGEIHRPPTYQVVLEGPAEGVELGDAAQRLAALMRKPVTEMLALLSGGRRTVVKKGIFRYQAEQYVKALHERAGCRTTLAQEPGPVAHPKPPAPAPVLAPIAPPAVQPAMPPMSSAAAKREADAEAAAMVVATANGSDAELFDVAEGVRLMCCAIGLNFLLRGVIQIMTPVPAAFSSLLVLSLMIYGSLRLTSGLGYGGAVRTVITLVVLSPIAVGFAAPFFNLSIKALIAPAVISLIVMVSLSVTGTRRLKKAGYKVGLFGASKEDVRYLGAMASGERLQSTTLAWAIFILVFIMGMTGQVKGQATPKELTSADLPCEFVGSWEVQKEDGKYAFEVNADSTYSATLIAGYPTGRAEYSGRWMARGATLYWSDEAFTPVRAWATKVVAKGQDEFIAVDASSGKKEVFRLQKRAKSGRCKY